MISLSLLIAVAIGISLAVSLLSRKDKLAKFSGPFLAKWTDLWVVWHLYQSRHVSPQQRSQRLHKKYGRIVRIGPNRLWFDNFEDARDIYNVSDSLKKSDWYLPQTSVTKGQIISNLFTSTNVPYHDAIRRIANRPFGMSALPSYEPQIVEIVEKLQRAIGARFADKPGSEGVFDISKWMMYFAADSISAITLTEPYGFIDSDSDVFNLMHDSRTFMRYAHYIGHAPWIDRLFLKNPIWLWLQRRGIAEYTINGAAFAAKVFNEREAKMESDAGQYNDILASLFKSKQARPDIMNDEEINKLLIVVILAGADTTSSLIVAILRYLLKNPSTYERLQAEVDKIEDESQISYMKPQNAPYLDSVIKETSRVHAVVGFQPERVTPPQGMKIAGVEIPGDVKVGVTVWAASCNTATWGDDAQEFRPERWLEMDEATNRKMANKLMLFGLGKYQCLGMHIAYAEIYKLIPMLLKSYRLELEQPDSDWQLESIQITYPYELRVRASRRNV